VRRHAAPLASTSFSRGPMLFSLRDSLNTKQSGLQETDLLGHGQERLATTTTSSSTASSSRPTCAPPRCDSLPSNPSGCGSLPSKAYVCSTKLAPLVAIDPSPALGMEGVHNDGFIGATVCSCPRGVMNVPE
jgi:hypothetical protein